jgi:tetratricopeptide (TPR) repeat protein
MNTRYLLLAVAAAGALLAGSCASTGPEGFSVRGLPERDDPLALAVAYTPELESQRERRRSYLRIAESYRARGDADTATAIADFVRGEMASGESPGGAAQTYLNLGSLYRRLQAPEAAAGAFASSLERLSEVSDDTTRFRILGAIVTASLDLGEPGIQLLSSAVEQVLVLESLWRRVELLMQISEGYIEEGSPQSVNSLIQQALPAAGTVENPYRRSAALGRIAVVYMALGEQGRSDELIGRAIDELPEPTNSPLDAQEVDALLQLNDHILELERPFRALNLVNRISDPAMRARGIRRIGEAYADTETPSAAYIVLSQGVRSADAASEPYSRAMALAHVAHGYEAVGDTQVALIRAESALRVLREVSEVDRQIEVRRTVLPILLAAEAYDRAITLPDPIGALSGYLSFSAETAVRLIEAGQESAVAQVLSATVGRISQSENGNAGAGFADLGHAYAEAGDRVRALETLTRIDALEPLLSGLTRVGAAVAPPIEEASLEQLNRLRDLLRSATQPL